MESSIRHRSFRGLNQETGLDPDLYKSNSERLDHLTPRFSSLRLESNLDAGIDENRRVDDSMAQTQFARSSASKDSGRTSSQRPSLFHVDRSVVYPSDRGKGDSVNVNPTSRSSSSSSTSELQRRASDPAYQILPAFTPSLPFESRKTTNLQEGQDRQQSCPKFPSDEYLRSRGGRISPPDGPTTQDRQQSYPRFPRDEYLTSRDGRLAPLDGPTPGQRQQGYRNFPRDDYMSSRDDRLPPLLPPEGPMTQDRLQSYLKYSNDDYMSSRGGRLPPLPPPDVPASHPPLRAARSTAFIGRSSISTSLPPLPEKSLNPNSVSSDFGPSSSSGWTRAASSSYTGISGEGGLYIDRYVCDQCGKAFNRPSALSTHIKSHVHDFRWRLIHPY